MAVRLCGAFGGVAVLMVALAPVASATHPAGVPGGQRETGEGERSPLQRRRAVVTRRQAALGALRNSGAGALPEDDPNITPDTALLLDPDVCTALAGTGSGKRMAPLRRAVKLARLVMTDRPSCRCRSHRRRRPARIR
ncbi:hypothetical protein [Amycolatopsis azurea]|uniref:Secreted protein n=1 Tax=Amycolatopsis azurea DSM 43854 TaxID=1238180 RepID=M2NNG3_9PSEU|nr:hypothetical protein [Amycolatopsis azurea]EMD23724.1 hypothetical protein C791_6810 [Amycolatopsis azurea DSM 43854]